MNLYVEVTQNPPKIHVCEASREVIFTVVSCMCDNISYIHFNDYGEGFKVRARNEHTSLSLSNYQMPDDYKTDLIWAADIDDWDHVIDIINSGTSKVCSARSRQ